MAIYIFLGFQYVYLVWVYFLYYVGAGYPSYYYPYILSLLLQYVPESCGGTGTGSCYPPTTTRTSSPFFSSMCQNPVEAQVQVHATLLLLHVHPLPSSPV